MPEDQDLSCRPSGHWPHAEVAADRGRHRLPTRPGRVVLALCTMVCFAAAPAAAQHFSSASELSEIIRSRVEEGGVAGIVLGVMEADGSTRIAAFGNPGPGALPLDSGSVFEIGSITKAFTGILLADMVATGEVSLSDPVADYLPDSVAVPSRGRTITLLDLATHHSGLPRLPGNMSPADASNPYADYTVEQLYAFLDAHELRGDVGAEYEYSNLGVGLLGHALAREAGSTYEELVTERILEPLGMDATGVTLDGEMRRRMVAGHNTEGNPVPLWDLPTLAGAGALRSSMADMLTFLGANMGAPESALERSMRASHEVRASAGQGMSVGLGWHVLQVGDEKIVWHNGGTGGFHSFIGFDPAANVGVVLLSNSAHSTDDVGFHLINPEIPLAPTPEPPRERVEIEVPDEILQSYVGEYQLAPTFSIVVTFEDGDLFAQATGQMRFPIFAESTDEFFYRAVDAQITFQRDPQGVVTGLVLHQGGRDIPGQKADAP